MRSVPLEVYEAVHRLNQHKDFQRFAEHLRDCLREEDRKNRYNDGTALHQGQGRAQQLAAMLDLMAAARNVVHGKNPATGITPR